MTTVYWMVKLRPGATAEAYQAFVKSVDYPAVRRIASIRDHTSHRVVGSIPRGADVPYDFIDVTEVEDLKAYLDDLENHPAVQDVHSQSPKLVEVIHCVIAETVARA